jgi:hypothetical protein
VHDIVKEGVAGTGIESDQIVVLIDIGDVGDAACDRARPIERFTASI